MTPAQIKEIRTELACSARELGEALGVDQKTVLDWETGERFPTKRHADALLALRKEGPSAISRRARPKPAQGSTTPFQTLADPRLWLLLRKLLAHDSLREEVLRLAASYADPAGE